MTILFRFKDLSHDQSIATSFVNLKEKLEENESEEK